MAPMHASIFCTCLQFFKILNVSTVQSHQNSIELQTVNDELNRSPHEQNAMQFMYEEKNRRLYGTR